MTSTELSPILKRGQLVLKEGGSLKEAAQAMVTEAPLITYPESLPFPAPAKTITITQDMLSALERLSETFGQVCPDTRRELTREELALLCSERRDISAVLEPMTKRKDAIGTIVRHHIDCKAEAEGQAVPRAVVDPETGETIVAATPRDVKGHYILASKGKPCQVPGDDGYVFSEQYSSGKTSFDDATDKLLAMYEAGDITREEYLACTREVRAYDEGKVNAFIQRNPERGLEILQSIATHSPAGTAIYVRKASS